MDDICRELGMSKKTLYQYVESKSDLIAHILQYKFDEHTKNVMSLMDGKFNAIDVLLAVSRKVCLDMQDFHPSTTFDLQKYYPEIFRTHYEAKMQAIFNDIKANINKGIAEGLGVKDPRYVNSPTFVIIKEYAGRLPLYHFDLYRLEGSSIIDSESYEEYFYGNGVTVIEWADKIRELLPKKYWEVDLKVAGENKRKIQIKKK